MNSNDNNQILVLDFILIGYVVPIIPNLFYFHPCFKNIQILFMQMSSINYKSMIKY